MPWHDERGMVKASPVASCTRESAIIVGMDREGRGGTGCKRGTGGPIGKAKAGRGQGQRDSLRDTTHSPPHHTGGRSTLLYGTAASLREIPDLKNFVGKCKRENALSALCITMSSSVYATGVCV
jgi:hypothetical protein